MSRVCPSTVTETWRDAKSCCIDGFPATPQDDWSVGLAALSEVVPGEVVARFEVLAQAATANTSRTTPGINESHPLPVQFCLPPTTFTLHRSVLQLGSSRS